LKSLLDNTNKLLDNNEQEFISSKEFIKLECLEGEEIV